jgi:hypothetical protein
MGGGEVMGVLLIPLGQHHTDSLMARRSARASGMGWANRQDGNREMRTKRTTRARGIDVRDEAATLRVGGKEILGPVAAEGTILQPMMTLPPVRKAIPATNARPHVGRCTRGIPGSRGGTAVGDQEGPAKLRCVLFGRETDPADHGEMIAERGVVFVAPSSRSTTTLLLSS